MRVLSATDSQRRWRMDGLNKLYFGFADNLIQRIVRYFQR